MFPNLSPQKVSKRGLITKIPLIEASNSYEQHQFANSRMKEFQDSETHYEKGMQNSLKIVKLPI